MDLGIWFSSSGFLLSKILLCWSWILLAPFPLLDDLYVHVSDGPGVLNFAACVSTLISSLSSLGCTPVTISIADMGVLRMAPVILMAWCCTLDSMLEFDFAAVELAAIPYLRIGRIFPI